MWCNVTGCHLNGLKDHSHETGPMPTRLRERCGFVYTSFADGWRQGIPCPFTREQHPLLNAPREAPFCGGCGHAGCGMRRRKGAHL